MSFLPVEQAGTDLQPSRRGPGRAPLPRPSAVQSILSLSAGSGRERSKVPPPACHVLAPPAEYSTSPLPAGSSPPLPLLPNAPSPADRPCANKRPPYSPAQLWCSAGQAVQVGPP